MKKLVIAISFLTLNTYADTTKGWEIAKKMDETNSGYIGETSTMKLLIVDSGGGQIEREIEGKSLEKSDMDKTLMNFIKPLDVKGTKLLTWSRKNDKDDQWLYLPSLKRVKKINSDSKGSSFMGSEFSFEDLAGQSIEKYTYDLKSEGSLGNQKVYVLERTPKEKSSYNKVVLYVSTKNYTTLKSEYYKNNTLLKVGTFSDFKEYVMPVTKKKIVRPGKIEMNNVQNKNKSIFVWENRVIGKAISESVFTQESLK